jgi:transcriptional regulator with XRE-family HTH domain
MARWSDYTTGERLKILRGPGLTQERLAEAAGLSVATIRKAERDLGVVAAGIAAAWDRYRSGQYAIADCWPAAETY